MWRKPIFVWFFRIKKMFFNWNFIYFKQNQTIISYWNLPCPFPSRQMNAEGGNSGQWKLCRRPGKNRSHWRSRSFVTEAKKVGKYGVGEALGQLMTAMLFRGGQSSHLKFGNFKDKKLSWFYLDKNTLNFHFLIFIFYLNKINAIFDCFFSKNDNKFLKNYQWILFYQWFCNFLNFSFFL